VKWLIAAAWPVALANCKVSAPVIDIRVHSVSELAVTFQNIPFEYFF
jgi:hypothetical protein